VGPRPWDREGPRAGAAAGTRRVRPGLGPNMWRLAVCVALCGAVDLGAAAVKSPHGDFDPAVVAKRAVQVAEFPDGDASRYFAVLEVRQNCPAGSRAAARAARRRPATALEAPGSSRRTDRGLTPTRARTCSCGRRAMRASLLQTVRRASPPTRRGSPNPARRQTCVRHCRARQRYGSPSDGCILVISL